MPVGRKAIFLDRDGTINRRAAPHEYISSLDDFELLPGSVEGMDRLAACGFLLVVASNQRGIARGMVSEEFLRASEAALQSALSASGAQIAAFYYCPHDFDDGCDCRKPLPGMLLSAADDLGIDLERSWMVGDSASDMEAGAAAGCRTVSIGKHAGPTATIAARSLCEAAELICAGA